MKLKPKLQAIELPVIHIGKREGMRLLAAAAKGEADLKEAATRTKNLLVGSCLNLFEARFAFAHGEWDAECALYGKFISKRTIERRIAFARNWLIPYVILKSPDIEHPCMSEIRDRARKIEIPSLLEMSITLREHGVAIEFGDYYAEDYQNRKRDRLLGQGEFDFSATLETLGALCKNGFPKEIEKAEQFAVAAKAVADQARRHLKHIRQTINV